MPVNVDKNLTIKNNTLDATNEELFKKLNVAYAWTNTQTSGTTGTLASYNAASNFIKFINCTNSNNFSIDTGNSAAPVIYILNGELYVNYKPGTLNNIKLGSNNDWKLCSCIYHNYSSSSSFSFSIYAINNSGKLYYISYSHNNYSEQQIGTDTKWSDISVQWAINDGKLYYISSATATQIGTSDKWTYLSKSYEDGGYSSSARVYGINNNYFYSFYNNSYQPVQVISCNDAKYFRGFLTTGSSSINQLFGMYVAQNDDIYVKKSGESTFTKIGNIPNIIKLNGVYGTSYIPITFITSDGKAGFIICDNGTWSYYYFNESINWTDISYGVQNGWYTLGTITSTTIAICYAIGDGKLYEIRFSSNKEKDNDSKRIYTIKDNNTNWKKVYGVIIPETIYGTSNEYYSSMYAFNSNDEITISTTVYTTKNPQGGDDVYYDCDLNKKSVVVSSTSSTVTDDLMTYTRDPIKNLTFTAIPPATIHETVSTIDFLRITNPNT